MEGLRGVGAVFFWRKGGGVVFLISFIRVGGAACDDESNQDAEEGERNLPTSQEQREKGGRSVTSVGTH